MSDRLRRSSTKYGPSVSEGVTMHVGVARLPALEDGEGEGEAREAEGPRPAQAATIALNPRRRAVLRETMAANRELTVLQSRARNCTLAGRILGIR
jgi:hypothetical protein